MMAGRQDLSTVAVRPFVPAKDYALSKRFYQALGFNMVFEADDVSGFTSDTGAFLLQNYYQEDWAGNFMMQMMVRDVNAWWDHIQSLDLPGQFGTPKPKPPTRQPWGLIVAYVVDPSGVLWHVAQAPI